MPGRTGVVAAESLLAVAGPRQARAGSAPLPVRAGRQACWGRMRRGGVLLRAAHRLHGRVRGGRAGQQGERRVLRLAINQSRDGAFAQVRWVVAAESGTGSPPGAATGGYRTAEQPLARDLLRQECFRPGMLVLADHKFLSWSLARDFLATGAHILWRASASFALKPVKALHDGTYLAELKPPRKSDGPVITVRVIKYTVHTAPTAGGEEGTWRRSPWSPACLTWRSTRRWTWRSATRGGGAARPSSATTRRTWARASLSCGRRTRPGCCRKCGRFSPSPRRYAGSSDHGETSCIPPAQTSFPHALAAAKDSVAAFSP